MTTALGDRSRTGVLLANDLGTSNEPVNNLYVNNIIPPAGGATLQDVCDNGNETTTNLIVKGTGRLGVGTTTPEKLLHIKGDTAPTLRITDTPNNTRLDLLSGDTSATIETFSNHPLLIGTNNQERMRITAGGDVGIGTTAPSSLLEIKGAGAKHIIHATSGNPELEFNDAGTDEFSIYFDTGNKSLNFNEAGVGTHLVIKDGGNVGVGTTSPSSKLDVNGLLSFEQARRKATIQGSIGSPTSLILTPPASRSSFTLDADDYAFTIFCQPVAASNQTLIFELDTNITDVLETHIISVACQTAALNGGVALGYNNVAISSSVKTPANTQIITVLVNLSVAWTVETMKVRVNIEQDGY